MREFIAGGNSDAEAVAKIETMLRSRFANYRIVSAQSVDFEELCFTKKEFRNLARRDAIEKKQAEVHYFGKNRIRNYKAFVQLNSATYYPDAA